VVATEFVGTSISSNGDGEVYGPYYGPMIRFNPHISFFDGDRRGYLRCQVDRARLRTDLQVVTTVSRPDAPQSTFASFVVEHDRARFPSSARAPGAVAQWRGARPRRSRTDSPGASSRPSLSTAP
jgi:phosphodiesterase/alkaline phosphatase D-like protein